MPGRSAGSGTVARLKLRQIFGADLRSLALFRIALGILTLWDLAVRIPLFGVLYGDGGVFPSHYVENVTQGWVTLYFPYLIDGSRSWLNFLAVLSVAFAVTLTLGYRTQVSTFVSWFLMVSMHVRNPLASSYEDQILPLLLFFALFVPLGERFSLDARAGRRWYSGSGLIATGGTAALFVQFVAIYFFTALQKSGAAWHADGTAIYYALSQNVAATSLASSLLEFPWLMTALTHTVYYWELLVGLAFFAPVFNTPLRILAVVSVWAFHTGLLLFLNLGHFPFVLMGAVLVFLPSWFWERLEPGGAPASRPAPASGVAIASTSARDQRLRAVWENVIPMVMIAYVLTQNTASLQTNSFLPEVVNQIGATFRLKQNWKMYAPEPLKTDHYYVMRGSLRDGSQVDLLRDARPVSMDPPETRPWSVSPRPWFLYLEHTRKHRREVPLHDYLASWMCRSWNASHMGGHQLLTLEWFIQRYDLTGASDPRLELLGSWDCATDPSGFTRPRVPRD